MDIEKWIEGYQIFLIYVATQSLVIVGLVCGFAALFMSTFKDDNLLLWLLFFDLPLIVFVGCGLKQSYLGQVKQLIGNMNGTKNI